MEKTYRKYDPRLRNLVAPSANLSRFILMGIPKSTLREWQKKGQQEFITLPEFDLTATELIQANLNLSIKLAAAGAEQELLSTSINIFGFQVQYKRLPSTAVKTDIIAAIRKAAMNIPLQKCLSTIGLSAALLAWHNSVAKNTNPTDFYLNALAKHGNHSGRRLVISEYSWRYQ